MFLCVRSDAVCLMPDPGRQVIGLQKGMEGNWDVGSSSERLRGGLASWRREARSHVTTQRPRFRTLDLTPACQQTTRCSNGWMHSAMVQFCCRRYNIQND